MTSRRAIIDIGSNSVRLVVYGGPRRAPAILFNEKVAAGLGRGLANDGALEAAGMEVALRGIARFGAIIKAMSITDTRAVATAAVRDASNGAEFLARARALGVPVEILSGEEEAAAAGYGVISALPGADGIVGDLGGGSLELVRVRDGEVGERFSLPLGVLRLPAIRIRRGALRAQVEAALKEAGWPLEAKNLPFYLVGGSWRALAKVHMAIIDHPLPVLHAYRMPVDAPRRARALLEPKPLKSVEAIAGSRTPVLGHAAALLDVLATTLKSSELVVSASGLREGLLYQKLKSDERRIDPLLAAARETGRRHARFEEHGDLVDSWIAPLFEGEGEPCRRVRHAASLLSDIAWDANPDFRAGRGAEIALHENWTGIDAGERAMLAQALYTCFGGAGSPHPAPALVETAKIEQARGWGLAIRLAQRLSGGAPLPLQHSEVSRVRGQLRLRLLDKAMYGEAVQKRHRQLADALGLEPALV